MFARAGREKSVNSRENLEIFSISKTHFKKLMDNSSFFYCKKRPSGGIAAGPVIIIIDAMQY